MPSFTVHCFNDAYPLYLFLNGLKSFLSSGDWSGYLFMGISIVTLFAILAAKQIDPIGYLRAYCLPILLFCVFFAQQARVNLQDDWANEAYSVDNLPIALVLPLHVTSTLEKIFVDLVDEHMTPPTSTSFKNFDFFLEAAALGEILNGQAFDNVEAQSSIGQYYEDCILKGISTGFISESKFYRSSDLLADMYTPYNVYFTMVYDKDKEPEVMTCNQAYEYIKNMVANTSVSTAPDGAPAYINHLFGNRFQSSIEVSAALDGLAESMFPGYQSTSEALFQQAFIMNGLNSNLAEENPEMLAALSQAEVAQATGIASASAVYIKKLPTLRAMMKLIIIGLVPIIAAFFLAQQSRPFWQWATSLLWVSLWLPMMGIIKATYIASAIDELHDMTLATGGMTMPNQMRIMAWISNTSTIAGTLGFMIPVLAGIALQFVAPRLASGVVSSFIAGARTSEGFAQRAGMGALAGAERTAKELEQDKVNQAFMEAGDVQSTRHGQMNQLFRNTTGVGVGNFFGSNPLATGGSFTSSLMEKGVSISGSSTSSMGSSISQGVTLSQAAATMMGHRAAQGLTASAGSTVSEQQLQQATETLSSEQRQGYNDVMSVANKEIESIGKTLGMSEAEVQTAQRSFGMKLLSEGGVSTSSGVGKLLEFAIGVKGGVSGKLDYGSTDSKADQRTVTSAVSDASQRIFEESNVASFSKSRSEALSNAETYLNSHGVSTANMSTMSASEALEKATTLTENATEAQSFLQNANSAVSNGVSFSVSTGTLAAHLQRDDMEDLAREHGGAMQRVHGLLAENPNASVDSLRRAAATDFATLARSSASGDETARNNFSNILEGLSEDRNFFYNAEAGQAAEHIRMQGQMQEQQAGQQATLENAFGEAQNVSVDGSPAFQEAVSHDAFPHTGEPPRFGMAMGGLGGGSQEGHSSSNSASPLHPTTSSNPVSSGKVDEAGDLQSQSVAMQTSPQTVSDALSSSGLEASGAGLDPRGGVQQHDDRALNVLSSTAATRFNDVTMQTHEIFSPSSQSSLQGQVEVQEGDQVIPVQVDLGEDANTSCDTPLPTKVVTVAHTHKQDPVHDEDTEGYYGPSIERPNFEEQFGNGELSNAYLQHAENIKTDTTLEQEALREEGTREVDAQTSLDEESGSALYIVDDTLKKFFDK